jgi:hypothetical protein
MDEWWMIRTIPGRVAKHAERVRMAFNGLLEVW